MKKSIIISLLVISLEMFTQQAEEMCLVEVCNKLERITFSLKNIINDKLGETCFTINMPKSEAVQGKVLSSESRWYQGSSINPTKKSVTRIKRVYSCSKK